MRLVALCCFALAVSAGTARADGWLVVPNAPLPSPNAETPLVPADSTAEPAAAEQLPVERLLPIWKAAGAAYGVPWTVLAAINKIESNFGENEGPSSAGAIGWMQFMPETWRMFGTDANGDGVASPWSAEDAIYSAARYLAASGAQTDLRRAIFAYNHARWYVDEVMNLAAVYASGGAELASAFTSFQVDLRAQKRAVEDARLALERAVAGVAPLQRARRRVLRAAGADLISTRLDARRRAAFLGVRITLQRRAIERLRSELAAAKNALASARAGARSLDLGPSSGYVASAPAFSGSFAFPVGGGQGLVSVELAGAGETLEIAAPAGSPVFAFADVTVQAASSEPDGDCGIGATLQTADGQTWTYCHLAYLDVAAAPGASLSAGAFLGLVGQTGSASAPQLSLQLQGAVDSATPQEWLTPFAGSAFRWQQPVASAAVFAPAPSDDPTLNSSAGSADR